MVTVTVDVACDQCGKSQGKRTVALPAEALQRGDARPATMRLIADLILATGLVVRGVVVEPRHVCPVCVGRG